MIDYHRFCQIKHLQAHQGLTASQIAKELALDPRTVAYWLGQEYFRPRKSTPRILASDSAPVGAVIRLSDIPLRGPNGMRVMASCGEVCGYGQASC